MSEKPEEMPEAVGGIDGESDVVAERSGAQTPKSRRPLLADLPDDEEEPEEEETASDEDVTRPDAGPTG